MVAGISPKEVAVLGHISRPIAIIGNIQRAVDILNFIRHVAAAISIDICRRRSGCGKAAARRCCYRSTGQTDRQTDRRTDTVLYYRCSRLEPGGVSNYQLLIRTVRTVCGADSL